MSCHVMLCRTGSWYLTLCSTHALNTSFWALFDLCLSASDAPAGITEKARRGGEGRREESIQVRWEKISRTTSEVA